MKNKKAKAKNNSHFFHYLGKAISLVFGISSLIAGGLATYLIFNKDILSNVQYVKKQYLSLFDKVNTYPILELSAVLFLLIAVYYLAPFFKKVNKDNPLFVGIKNVDQAKEKLNPETFEEFVAYLYRKKGFKAKRVGFGANVKKTKKDGVYGDGGKDVVISHRFCKDTIIQCKFYNNPVGVSVVREMFAILMHYKARKVIIVTTSFFSRDAVSFAKGKKVELVNYEDLDKLIKSVNK